jgi:hypothetical protein
MLQRGTANGWRREELEHCSACSIDAAEHFDDEFLDYAASDGDELRVDLSFVDC